MLHASKKIEKALPKTSRAAKKSCKKPPSEPINPNWKCLKSIPQLISDGLIPVRAPSMKSISKLVSEGLLPYDPDQATVLKYLDK